MSPMLRDIGLLALVVCLYLLALTIFGERLRARRTTPDPAIEVFMTRVDSWWAMVVLFTLSLLAGQWAVALLFAVASFAALRAFKQAFHPDWQPRYIAVPPGLSPTRAMTNVALLIAGGPRRLFGK